jgi:hypothetical protein
MNWTRRAESNRRGRFTIAECLGLHLQIGMNVCICKCCTIVMNGFVRLPTSSKVLDHVQDETYWLFNNPLLESRIETKDLV